MLTPTLSRLRLARLNAGLTQYLLAKRARLSAARVSLLERGHEEPESTERAALARALAVSEDSLFPIEPVATAAQLDGTRDASLH